MGERALEMLQGLDAWQVISIPLSRSQRQRTVAAPQTPSRT